MIINVQEIVNGALKCIVILETYVTKVLIFDCNYTRLRQERWVIMTENVFLA